MDHKDLFAATYTNVDVAYALNLPNFTDYRKNWERGSFMQLPRAATLGPKGPEYRLAHVYEYALFSELTIVVKQETAAAVLKAAFDESTDRAWLRVNELSDEDRAAVWNSLGDEPFDDANDPRNRFAGIVQQPKLYLHRAFLDRDDDNPWFFLFFGSAARKMIMARGEVSLHQAHADLKKRYLKDYVNPDQVDHRPAAGGYLNVTQALSLVDYRLGLRLRGRETIG